MPCSASGASRVADFLQNSAACVLVWTELTRTMAWRCNAEHAVGSPRSSNIRRRMEAGKEVVQSRSEDFVHCFVLVRQNTFASRDVPQCRLSE